MPLVRGLVWAGSTTPYPGQPVVVRDGTCYLYAPGLERAGQSHFPVGVITSVDGMVRARPRLLARIGDRTLVYSNSPNPIGMTAGGYSEDLRALRIEVDITHNYDDYVYREALTPHVEPPSVIPRQDPWGSGSSVVDGGEGMAVKQELWFEIQGKPIRVGELVHYDRDTGRASSALPKNGCSLGICIATNLVKGEDLVLVPCNPKVVESGKAWEDKKRKTSWARLLEMED